MTNIIKCRVLTWYPKLLCHCRLTHASVLPEAFPPKAFEWEGGYVRMEY